MADSYVGKPCPKCKHIRTASEIAPDWQCPKCGAAYAKFPAAQQGLSTTKGGAGVPLTAAAPASGSTGLGVFAHVSLVIGLVVPFFSLIVPLIIWMTQKGKNEFAVSCAKEAINFQISLLLWALAAAGIYLVASAIFIPLVYIALVIAVVLVPAAVLLPIVAAAKAMGGKSHIYQFIWHPCT